MLIPDKPGTAYPLPTPQEPLTLCGDGVTERFRVNSATCDSAYLWYGGRPPFHEYDEIFVYAESVVPDGWSMLAPTEFITWTNNGELFFKSLDHEFMSGKMWIIKGWVFDNEFSQYICETENAILVDCTGAVPKSIIRLPAIYKAPWLIP